MRNTLHIALPQPVYAVTGESGHYIAEDRLRRSAGELRAVCTEEPAS